MGQGNQPSHGWRWVIGVVCVVLLIWMLNQRSSSSSSVPTGISEQTPSADSTDVAPTPDNPPPQSPKTFAGYECTEDCSGHEAGYKWAEEHDIDNQDDCDSAGDTSNSPSFAEGCKAYVNGDSPDEEDDDDPDN